LHTPLMADKATTNPVATSFNRIIDAPSVVPR
jgi:hypothetical protein